MINLCEECSIKEICLIHSDFKKHADKVKMELTNCDYRIWTGSKYSNHNNGQPITISKDIDPYTGKKKVDRDKITALSNKAREERLKAEKELAQKAPKPKNEFKAEPLKLDYTCPTCNGTTFEEDKGTCDECGAIVCSCCATIDGDTKKILCSECWKKL